MLYNQTSTNAEFNHTVIQITCCQIETNHIYVSVCGSLFFTSSQLNMRETRQLFNKQIA